MTAEEVVALFGFTVYDNGESIGGRPYFNIYMDDIRVKKDKDDPEEIYIYKDYTPREVLQEILYEAFSDGIQEGMRKYRESLLKLTKEDGEIYHDTDNPFVKYD